MLSVSRTGKVRELTFREGLIAELVLEMDDGATITVDFTEPGQHFGPAPLDGRYAPLNGLGLAQVTVTET